MHHNEHVHFGGLPETLGRSGAFVAEDQGDNTSLEICLTATDDGARARRLCRLLLPLEILYTLDTEPSGLRVIWDGVTYETPIKVQTIAGATREPEAPARQTWNGARYQFVSWSDGGGATHAVTVAREPQRLVSTYVVTP